MASGGNGERIKENLPFINPYRAEKALRGFKRNEMNGIAGHNSAL